MHQHGGSMQRLVVFDAVVKSGSFTAAAKTLRVSQPAVSRQIGLLEDELSTALFARSNNLVALTPAGQALSVHVDRALTELEAGFAQLRLSSDQLTLAVPPSVMESWISPRLAELRTVLAPTHLRLVIYDLDSELGRLDHDVSIRFSDDGGFGSCSQLLITESVAPVASPAFARQWGLVDTTSAAVLAESVPLLYLDQSERRWMGWVQWFAALDVDWAAPSDKITFPSYSMLIQQALGGRGVLLAWRSLLGDLVDRNLLVGVGPAVEQATSGYHIVWPKALSRDATERRLHAWLADLVDELDHELSD